MSKLSESEIKQKFREYISRKKLPEDLKVTCRVTGGIPSEHVEEEFTLVGKGMATAMKQNMLDTAILYETTEKLRLTDTRKLLQQIGEGLDSLVTRSDARFLPDSLVGAITIEVGGEKATFYYLANEEDRLAQDKSISPQMSQAIKSINTISKRLIKKKRGEK